MTNDTTSPASVRIAGEPNDRNIDLYELQSARRALRLLKGNLGGEQLLELVSPQVKEGNDLFREHVKQSAGREVSGSTTIETTGLSAADFSEWMMRAFAREDVLIAAQPEHYLMHMSDPKGPHVVETLGDHVVGFYMRAWDQSGVDTHGESTDKRHSTLRLDDDDTLFGSVSTEFIEASGGMKAELSVTLPATAPHAVEQHLQHFSVEFRSWMLQAAAETAANKS